MRSRKSATLPMTCWIMTSAMTSHWRLPLCLVKNWQLRLVTEENQCQYRFLDHIILISGWMSRYQSLCWDSSTNDEHSSLWWSRCLKHRQEICKIHIMREERFEALVDGTYHSHLKLCQHYRPAVQLHVNVSEFDLKHYDDVMRTGL